ncbi:hypothetical protein ACFSM5_11340 [Lacibacterium aquatile]|uniref:Uncharacterized protein n=1 Tax=Lacibacterium aquatile TaxID=1168082 RepID=A0ABW5DSV0_9PROT
MATTMFFDKTLQDKGSPSEKIDLEFGRSSFYDGESLMYFVIDGKTVIVDEKTGREIYERMQELAGYLGYDRP